jgi:hypothetical protein
MDNDAIQKEAPVAAPRGPVDGDERRFRRLSRTTLERDKSHLRILSICFYVMSGYCAFSATLALLYFPLGYFFVQTMPPAPGGPGPLLGYSFLGSGFFALTLNGVYACLLFVCARSLRAYKRRMLIVVMACLLCGGIPSIILGIFTILVLSRESVKELFQYGDLSPDEIDSLPRTLEDDNPSIPRFTVNAMRNDLSQLRTLSIIYYVAGVVVGVFGLFPGIYVALGVLMASGSMGSPPKAPPPEMGYVFILGGSLAILVLEALAICVFVAGRSLATHKRYIFCFVIAALLCLTGIPIIVLGVFSMIVLARESVAELFAHGELAFGLDPDDD